MSCFFDRIFPVWRRVPAPLAALIAAGASLCAAGDWPHWRGPSFNGVAEGETPPAVWDASHILWEAPMPGLAESTPIVVGERVYATSVDAAHANTYAICLDRDTGREIYRTRIGEAQQPRRHTSATPSPVVFGDTAIFLYGTGDLAALDAQGEIVWQRNLESDFGPIVILWTYGSSPLLYRGKLYIPVLRNPFAGRGGPMPGAPSEPYESYLLCVDPATGKDLWKQTRPTDAVRESPEAYTTPIPFERPGGAEILVSGGDYITAHDPETGEERWRFHYNPNKHPAYRQVVSPLAFGDIVVCVQPRHTTVFAFRAPQSGSHSFDEALWVYGGAVPDVVAPLHYRGRLYVMHGVQGKLACLEPETGKEIWQQDLGVKNKFYASPSAADGRLYLINIDGEAITIEAGDEYKELCRVSLGGRAVTGSIAIADNKLFIRGDDRLLCIGAK